MKQIMASEQMTGKFWFDSGQDIVSFIKVSRPALGTHAAPIQ
jgi:hypothetical protein